MHKRINMIKIVIYMYKYTKFAKIYKKPRETVKRLI